MGGLHIVESGSQMNFLHIPQYEIECYAGVVKIGMCEASCTEKCSYSLLEFFLIPFIRNFMSKLARWA